jgi:hypothetical protein
MGTIQKIPDNALWRLFIPVIHQVSSEKWRQGKLFEEI